jgi:hypothetical protein
LPDAGRETRCARGYGEECADAEDPDEDEFRHMLRLGARAARVCGVPIPGVFRQPGAYCRRFVGAVVVADQAHGELGRDILVDGDQEFLELGRSVLAVQLADDRAVGDVERGEQAGDAVQLSVSLTHHPRELGLLTSLPWLVIVRRRASIFSPRRATS